MTEVGLEGLDCLVTFSYPNLEASVSQGADALKLHLICSGMGRYATAGRVWFGVVALPVVGNTG